MPKFPVMPSSMRSSSVSSSSSEEEDKVQPANGKQTNGIISTAEIENEPEEPFEPGMKTGMKNLYSGKEDKKGRYQWQDTIPADVGNPVENAETAKWALIVRNVKVYNDPTKVLAIHSIVVQSPLLKKLLARVLKNYPGLTVGLQRLEFSGKFEPLIHRWTELQKAINELGDESEEDRTTKEHAGLLQEVLTKEFQTLISTSQDLISKRVMTYEHLWTLFQPGAVIFSRQDGQETAMALVETKYGVDAKGVPCFWIMGKYVDWDGARFGTQKMNFSISIFSGTRSISQLRAYPLDYHPEAETVRARLIERGAKAEQLAGPNFRAYEGVAWRHGAFGQKDKHNVTGRIVVDTFAWNRWNPTYAIFVTPLTQKESSPKNLDPDDGGDEYGDAEDYDGGDDSGMPLDGHFADEEDNAKHVPLTTEQKLICTPLLRGYSLKSKIWLNFFVNCVKEIEWQKNAFDRLVLPKNQKELILGFTESQRKYRETFDDVIEGKGKGMILLLCGPPGVGKTLTAESVAEEMKVS